MITQIILLVSLFITGPILISFLVLKDSFLFRDRVTKYLYSFVLSWVCLFVYLQTLFQLGVSNVLNFYFSSLLLVSLFSTSYLLLQTYRSRKKINISFLKAIFCGIKSGIDSFSVFLLIIGLVLVTITISIPYFENDSLEYLRGGIDLLSLGNLTNYPFTDTSESDIYLPSSHPPTFQLFLGLINEVFGSIAIVKVITVIFFLAIIAPPLKSIANPFLYSLCFISVPLFVFSTFTYPMDIIRIGVYWVAFSLLFNLKKEGSFHLIRSVFILSTVSSTHSLGLLMALTMLLMLFWKDRFSIPRFISLFMIFSFIFSAQYVRNFFQNGSFVADSWTSSPFLNASIMKDLIERRELDTLPNIIINGVGAPLFHPRFFGFVFTILLLQIIFIKFHISLERHSPFSLNLLMLLMYLAITLFFTSIGDINLIKNFRYPLAVLPNVVFCVFTFHNLKRRHASK
jgi:hypothetical protein